MNLKQYRKKNWPVVGSFALGVLSINKKNWDFYIRRNSDLTEAELSSPFGGYYIWYRRW